MDAVVDVVIVGTSSSSILVVVAVAVVIPICRRGFGGNDFDIF
jgi:hypothetical protein